MTLSDISIKRPVFAWMLMAGLLVFGVISYLMMGISQLPDVDFPVVNVSVTWEGASPKTMESAVTDVIENAVMSVQGIQDVSSTSQEGQATVTITFGLDTNIDTAVQQVQAAVSSAQRNLPQSIFPPVITKTNPDDQPIMWAAVYSTGKSTLRDLALFVRDHLQNAITTINGVGNIFEGGYVAPEMRVWLNNKKMNEDDVTFQDVINAINSEHELAPTGYQDDGNHETYVNVHSQFTNAKECDDLYIPARAGIPVYKAKIKIGDVASCEEGTDDIRRISRFDGITPTIGIGVIKQPGTNAVTIAQAVHAKIKELQRVLPPGMKMKVVSDMTVFIKQAIHELLFTLLVAVLLTSLVCYLFLGSWSSAFNVILAIPVSLIGAFIVLHALNFTINTFTLLALSLSIGIVVDDAIMVLENITRHVEDGKQRVLAALVGAREITGAAVASSLAILAIFVPVIFMPGIVGKFFFQFGVTLSVAVLISLLEALTLAPMRCSQFLAKSKENFLTRPVNQGIKALTRGYKIALEWCLERRVLVLVAATIVFLGSLWTIKGLRKEFVPPQDQSRFLVTVYTKMGSSLNFTDHVFRRVEALYKSRPEIKDYYVAEGGFGGGLVNQGMSFVTMHVPSKRPLAAPFKHVPTQQEFMQYLRGAIAKLPGVQRVSMLDLSLAGFSAHRGFPIEFELQGPEWKQLAALSLKMRKALTDSKLMADVDTDYNPDMPETEIYPNRRLAAQMGVDVTTISNAISAMVGGLDLLPNAYTDSAGHRDDIKVQLVKDQNRDPADISKIMVRNIYGWTTPLKSLITVKPGETLLTITRYNRERGIDIFGNFAPGVSQSKVMDYINHLAKTTLPPGYHITLTGSSQAFKQSLSSMLMALFLGIFVAYMVLASQFNSFIHPAVILLALPFSLTGALWAMDITNTSINIYSFIGILLLMGIVKKNSILLVEFTNQRREEGADVNSALIDACPLRLRPILMTSVATIAGALPEALLTGAGSETMHPMAIAVIGGVIVSTCLTLFVVPCAYSLASNLESGRHRKDLHQALVTLGERQEIPSMMPTSGMAHHQPEHV